MKDPIISLQNIGIKYQLKGKPRESLTKLHQKILTSRKNFWALRDINLDIHEGEILFIIGRNGAGKSTLLKVMAETLFPDEGCMTLTNCRTSFISMGLGFRKELTGYENMDIALKLLGIPKQQLKKTKEEIIQFSQLDHFIYEPVENYSAGMKSRLAFAIATSNTPDVLIMDEIINAGDEQFRDSCKERLNSMVAKAKAVIICTHNLQNVLSMGTKALWIEKGMNTRLGDPKEVVREYREFIKKVRNDPFYDQRQ